MVGVEEGWVSVCWQRGWQSRVTKGKLGRTGRSGCADVNAALSCVHWRSRCVGCECSHSEPLANLHFTSVTPGFYPEACVKRLCEGEWRHTRLPVVRLYYVVLSYSTRPYTP